MRNESFANRRGSLGKGLLLGKVGLPNKATVGAILIIALLAFEIFNFDTTRFALSSLLGDVRFLGMQWASILAIAFCSIDFAGLVRLFTPQRGADEPNETWYLMGAWLLGATMNAVMTWWAVSLTLLRTSFGNEVLSRDQLLFYVPIFVAVLVWLTRILFIGAFSVAGEHIFNTSSTRRRSRRATTTVKGSTAYASQPRRKAVPKHAQTHYADENQANLPIPAQKTQYTPSPSPQRSPAPASRVRQRPPMPNGVRRMPLGGVQARGRNNRA